MKVAWTNLELRPERDSRNNGKMSGTHDSPEFGGNFIIFVEPAATSDLLSGRNRHITYGIICEAYFNSTQKRMQIKSAILST